MKVTLSLQWASLGNHVEMVYDERQIPYLVLAITSLGLTSSFGLWSC